MNIKEYSEAIKRTKADLKYKEKDNLHMVLGIVTEAGELADVFKKNMAYNKKIDWVNVAEELGDLMWYICNFCNINNLNIEEIMGVNVEKLKSRYPEKFTDEKANNRDLQREREILEK